MTREEHIDTLADALNVRVVHDAQHWRESWAHYDLRTSRWTRIHVPHAYENEHAYWSCLHELGHAATTCLDPGTELRAALRSKSLNGRGPVSVAELDCEAAAWDWALDASMEVPTPEALWAIRASLNSYARHCSNVPASSLCAALIARLDELEAAQ